MPAPAPAAASIVLQVQLRNRRFEEHSALVGHASFLRRHKKPRSLSFNDTSGRADLSAASVGPVAGVAAATASRRPGATTAILEEVHEGLRRPCPLDLPAVVTPGVAKNQGTDVEEAFRAVGLTTTMTTTSRGAETKNAGEQQAVVAAGSSERSLPLPPKASTSPLSPPHLFWKAVVLGPSRARGNVGAWLEAKFGGGGVSTYRQDLAYHGLCPGPGEGCVSGPAVDDDDDREVACGGSGSAKLIYRELR